MEYAKSLIKAKANKNTKQQPSKQEGHGGEVHDDEASDDDTEEWTFVGSNVPGDGGAEFPDAAYRRQESAKSGDAPIGLGLGLGASSSGGGKALGSKVLSGA